jgi:hypothetical protein
MTALKLSIAGLLVLASVVASVVVQVRAHAQARQRDALLSEHAQALAELATENSRLSNLVRQVKSSQPLSKDQFTELLRLRGQAGQLRQGAGERAELAAKNVELKTAAADREKALAEEQAAPNYWPRDQLSFVGYADPESAMRSMLWAMKSADVNNWRACCTPQAAAKLEKEWAHRAVSEADRMAELRAMCDAMMAGSTGFRILDQKFTSPDQAVINLSFVGEGGARKFVLRKIGDEWKFHNFLFTGQKEPR